MRKRLSAALLVMAAGAIVAMSAGKAQAIPAFARQTNAECSTCHTIIPELNEYGEAFYKNVYVLTGERSKRVKRDERPEGLILSGIPAQFPASLTAIWNLAYDRNPLNDDKVDLSSRAITLEAGLAIGDQAGMYISYNIYTQGIYEPRTSNVPLNNTPELNEAFAVWRHVFDSPVNVKIGRMKPKLSLWKSTNKSAVTTYAPLVYRVGASPFSVDSPEDALELNAILGSRAFVAAGVVDRNGQNQKEGYAHVSFKAGGADFNGIEPSIDFDESSIWDYTSLSLGAYYYCGRVATVTNQVADRSNKFYRTGAEADLTVKRFRARFSYVHGHDDNPFFDATIDPLSNIAAPTDVDSNVFAAEGQYLFGSNVLAAVRYEYQDAGPIKYFNTSSNAISLATGPIHRVIPSLAYAPKQCFKLVLEHKYEDTPIGTNNISNLGVVVSF